MKNTNLILLVLIFILLIIGIAIVSYELAKPNNSNNNNTNILKTRKIKNRDRDLVENFCIDSFADSCADPNIAPLKKKKGLMSICRNKQNYQPVTSLCQPLNTHQEYKQSFYRGAAYYNLSNKS